jgi:exodeoxyribonuclease-3
LRLLSWNIRHGGGARLPKIVAAIGAHNPDVIALTEFRTKPGAELFAALKANGFPYIVSTNPAGSDNGIAVISRTPMHCTLPCPAPPENVVRWLDIDFPEYGFGLGVLHILVSVPGLREPRGASMRRFWDAVTIAAEARLHAPFLFVGDWNTGVRGVDEDGKTFICAQYFTKLSTLGWSDLWRHHNPGPTERTWYSKLKGGAPGNGFRLDHAFATPSVQPRVKGCRYSHAEREAQISDHSIMILDVAEAAGTI